VRALWRLLAGEPRNWHHESNAEPEVPEVLRLLHSGKDQMGAMGSDVTAQLTISAKMTRYTPYGRLEALGEEIELSVV
jgi:hypothetical protein